MKSFDDFIPGKIYHFISGGYFRTPVLLISVKRNIDEYYKYTFIVLLLGEKRPSKWSMTDNMLPHICELT